MTHLLKLMLRRLQQRLSRCDPVPAVAHVLAQPLLVQPVTHLLLTPAGKRCVGAAEAEMDQQWKQEEGEAEEHHAVSHTCVCVRATSLDGGRPWL